MYRLLFLFLFFFVCLMSVRAQQEDVVIRKNQLSTNLFLPIFKSVDLNYERALGNKFALGLAGAVYSEEIEEITANDNYQGRDLTTKYEIMPFARIYFGGNQRKSHFLEAFGSISGVEESGRLIRTINEEGFGVYGLGTKSYARGGLGIGYGYRFLFFEGKMSVEAQFGIRTNFDVTFIVLNAALIRTGIRIGYRF